MAQVQGETRTVASLRIVFDNAVVSVPLGAATTFGDLAWQVRGISAQGHSRATAIAVLFADDRTAARVPAWGYELPALALTAMASCKPTLTPIISFLQREKRQ